DGCRGVMARDLISAGLGTEIAEGGLGNDAMYGGPGSDFLAGREAHVLIFGQKGDDSCLSAIDGIHGNDSVNGGPGHDTGDADTGDEVISLENRLQGSCSAE